MVLAVVFLGIKAYEYNSKFSHYQVRMNDGRVADGHMVENKEADHIVCTDVLWPRPRSCSMARRRRAEHEDSRSRALTSGHEMLRPGAEQLSGHLLQHHDSARVAHHRWHHRDRLPLGAGQQNVVPDPERFTNRVEVSGLFWHFVDLVWIFCVPGALFDLSYERIPP